MSTQSIPTIHTSRDARRIPEFVVLAMRSIEREANPILPALLKARMPESQGNAPRAPQMWLWVMYQGVVEFVLSLTEGAIGSYPLFIVSTLAFSKLSSNHSAHCMALVSQQLRANSKRIYSVFAPKPLANLFSQTWTQLTGIRPMPQLYYDAKISYLTSATMKRDPAPRSLGPRD